MCKTNVFLITALVIIFSVIPQKRVRACTRVVYQGNKDMVITGRTMDWKEDTRSNIWIFPRGMERNGEVGKDPMRWKSKYGSVERCVGNPNMVVSLLRLMIYAALTA